MRSPDVWLDAARTGAAQAYPLKIPKLMNKRIKLELIQS